MNMINEREIGKQLKTLVILGWIRTPFFYGAIISFIVMIIAVILNDHSMANNDGRVNYFFTQVAIYSFIIFIFTSVIGFILSKPIRKILGELNKKIFGLNPLCP